MALKGLSQFNMFDLDEFLREKRLLFVKALQWSDRSEQSKAIGTKIVVQIWEDNTSYSNPATSNFGEQLIIKVRNLELSAFDKWKPLATEVIVTDIERATIYGDYRNQLGIIASVKAKSTQ